jgi:hypothetical protein
MWAPTILAGSPPPAREPKGGHIEEQIMNRVFSGIVALLCAVVAAILLEDADLSTKHMIGITIYTLGCFFFNDAIWDKNEP